MVLVQKRQRMETPIFGQPFHTVMEVTPGIHSNQGQQFWRVGLRIQLEQRHVNLLRMKKVRDPRPCLILGRCKTEVLQFGCWHTHLKTNKQSTGRV